LARQGRERPLVCPRGRLCLGATPAHDCALELPQYLLECGSYRGQIAVTQPRRVAATSLAARVSAEQGQPLGTMVGYSVRFDERVGPTTRIKYLTDGMLVREMMKDPSLSCYNIVVVDEAHERTLRTDIVLASLKRILALRNGSGVDCNDKGKRKANPLKVVIMSATLDAEKFSKFFEKYVLWDSHKSKINTQQCPSALRQGPSAPRVHISYVHQPK
jgi:HrpA-like RNA helicase